MPQFTDKARVALQQAEAVSKKEKHHYVGSEHLLLGLLKEGTGVAATVLLANGIEVKKLQAMIDELIAPDYGQVILREKDGYSPRAVAILEDAHVQAKRFESETTGTEHLLLAILRDTDSVAVRLLNTLNIQIQKLYVEVLLAMGQDPASFKEELSKQTKKKPQGTPTLDQFSRDLTEFARIGKLDPVIGRDIEIQRVIQILSRRTKNNPCLIGEPGVGKTAIVEGLALRIVNNLVPDTVKGKRLVTLDLSAMVAGSKYRGEFEERIKKVLKEVMDDGNIILFLDEIHTIIGAGGAEGAIDASNILKPSLARGEIQLIGATTIAEYRKHIEKDAALERRFQPCMVEEPSEEEAICILQGVKAQYEKHHKVTISDQAIISAVKLSSRYINDRNLPDKAIDLIDEAASALKLKKMVRPVKLEDMKEEINTLSSEVEQSIRKNDLVTARAKKQQLEQLQVKYEKAWAREEKKQSETLYLVDEPEIATVVAEWTKIPVKKLAEKESERLLKLENLLHQRVIGQDEAVKAVARAMRRGRVGLQDPNRPIGSFLFLGPTGVGKTELSKALAEAMFGSENSLIRVDMSEYMESHSVSKMIGSPPGYVGFDDGGQLSEKIRKNPYSVVLFDEVEKAHPDVFNILLQVLDDGHITDSKGRKINFKNTIIIMTSNAGAQKIIEPKNLGFATNVTEKQEYEAMKSGVMEEVKRLFKPEFINRIDEIIVFHPLTKDNMKEIITLLSKNLMKRAEKQMNIHLSLSPLVKEELVSKYADLKMGARPLKRAIQTVIEDKLAEEILSGRVKTGDTVQVGFKNKEIVFSTKK